MNFSEKSIDNFLIKTRQFRVREGYELSTIQSMLKEADPLSAALAERILVPRLEAEIGNLDLFFMQCQSPIERLLAAALIEISDEQGYDAFYIADQSLTSMPGSAQDLIIEPQVQIDQFRIDFRISKKEYDSRLERGFLLNSVLVECDGHDFHERTKEQAKKDRSRDRKLQALGYSILRFTGSEIHSDPYKCAEEITAFLNKPGALNGKA